MLTVSEIETIILGGEGYNSEFKVSIPSKVKELTEEICAFANAAGGVLLVGVNDLNEIKGVNVDNAKRSAIQNSISEITPILDCTFSLVEVNGKTILAIEVPTGPDKPYVLSGAIYVRIGPNSQKLTTAEQMRDFFQQADKIHFDEVPFKEFNILSDIDTSIFNEFRTEAKLNSEVADHQIYSNLQMLTKNGSFKNGAVLFFGRNPEAYFDHAIVRCVSFRGTDKRYIMDDKKFGGPLYFQFLKAMEWLRGKVDVAYDIEGQGSGPRKEIWEVPENAFKESLINSLSHRDYYAKGATITVEVFDDRVEVSNPGGLVSAISKADFGTKSFSRNPLIFGLFTRMNMVEKIGSGISRMNKLMKEVQLPQPEYRINGMFTVIFHRPIKTSGKTSGKTQDEILRLIAEMPEITIPQLADSLSRTTRSIEMQIKSLREVNKLERIGPAKGGYWRIIE